MKYSPANGSGKHFPDSDTTPEEHIQGLLWSLGFDLNDPQIKDTPKRVAKMYREVFAGCYEQEPAMTVFPNTKGIDEMIILKDIRVKSMCAHHLLPFTGIAHIGYLPGKSICGISKLARVVHWFAKRPQIQEELTAQVAEYLVAKLKPKGVMVVIEAQHNCMICRGVQEFNSMMITSKVTGAFKDNIAAREEFLKLIGK